jgi:hypothetical protein
MGLSGLWGERAEYAGGGEYAGAQAEGGGVGRRPVCQERLAARSPTLRPRLPNTDLRDERLARRRLCPACSQGPRRLGNESVREAF